MAFVIPASPGTLLISIEYPADGVSWARLYDNEVLGWIVDEATGLQSKPVVIGQLPNPATAAPPVISPQWAIVFGQSILVPDMWRGSVSEFFDWLATNNDAERPLERRFVAPALISTFDDWAKQNPNLAGTDFTC